MEEEIEIIYNYNNITYNVYATSDIHERLQNGTYVYIHIYIYIKHCIILIYFNLSFILSLFYIVLNILNKYIFDLIKYMQ